MNVRSLVIVVSAVFLFLFLTGRVGDTPAAIVTSAAGALLTYATERKREVEAAQRERKIEAYNDFTRTLFVDIMAPIAAARAKGEQFQPTPDVEAKFAGVSAQVALWAEPAALKRYCDFLDETMTADGSVPSRRILDNLADAILKFRKDLGYDDRKLSRTDLYPLFNVARGRVLALPDSQPSKNASPNGNAAANLGPGSLSHEPARQ